MRCSLLLSLVALVALLSPLGAGAGPGDDGDRDGVPDFVDNCRAHPNLNQRDSDGDGFGNRCDPDLDGDGRVDLIDLALMSGRLFGADPHADLDSNGHVGRGDLRILRRFLFGGPGPGAAAVDSDADGVGDRDDRCVRSPAAGGAPIARGCNSFDLVRSPEAFVEPAADALGRSREHAASGRAHPDLHGLSQELEQHGAELREVAAELRLGRLCAAADRQRWSADQLVVLHGWLERTADSLRADLAESAAALAPAPGQPPVGDLRGAALTRSVELLAGARDAAGVLADQLATACAALDRHEHRRARVVAFEDAARLLRLDDGSTWLLADPAPSPFASAGRIVSVSGPKVSASGAIAWRLRSEQSSDPPAPGEACAELALAPVQGFAPWTERAPELHSPEAYRPRAAGPVFVEAGMRVALRSAQPTPACDAAPPEGLYWRDSAHVAIEYQRDGLERALVALDLRPGAEAVALPALPEDARRPVLRVEHRRQGCRRGERGPVCGPVVSRAERRWPLHAADTGAYCSAHYDAAGYALEGAGPRDWRAARVAELELGPALSAADDVTFLAEGCSIEDRPGLQPRSSCEHDVLAPVRLGERFAVHGQDFADPSPLHGAALHGVEARAALRWPRIEGQRGDSRFRYACRLPNLARDALDRCSPALVSFYRAPLGDAADASGAVAVQAARAGAVVIAHAEPGAQREACVEQRDQCEALGADDCWQRYACELPGHVYVRHADGSFGAYWNLSRVDVAPGQEVERGQPLGRAARPDDLHFRVQAEPRLDANPPRTVAFQTGDGSCWIAPAAPEGS